MRKSLTAMALTLFSLFFSKGYSDLSVDEFEKKLSEDPTVQLVDVRTPEEYAEGHLAGAINIDWYGEDFLEQAKVVLTTEKPVMVYCRSGKRSAAAAAKLDGAFYKTYNLKGGYLAWTDAGKPVKSDPEFHPVHLRQRADGHSCHPLFADDEYRSSDLCMGGQEER